MNNLASHKPPKISEIEEVVLPMVKCGVCGNMTTTGLHQIRLAIVKRGYPKKVNGKWVFVPAVAKQSDVYMCTRCVEKGRKWPGRRP